MTCWHEHDAAVGRSRAAARGPLSLWLALAMIGPGLFLPAEAAAAFPERPVKIVVYTGPGGLLDTTARLFADVARRYTPTTWVVENRPGAGGIVAIDSVLQAPADGYTLLACTKSNIAKILIADRNDLWQQLDWRAMLLADPECLIVQRGVGVASLEDLVADARRRARGQLWLGPGSGGLDHVTAVKVWDRLEIRGRWIPFTSGGEAITALMGGQGQVYVGNPQDAIGNPQLAIVAISSPRRLSGFPDVPVFRELGINDLDDQFIWRGFALKRNCPAEVLAWYDRLFQQVTNDPRWQSFWREAGATVFFRGPGEFAAQVQADRNEFQQYHRRLGLVGTTHSNGARPLDGPTAVWLIAAMYVAATWCLGWKYLATARRQPGYSMLPTAIALGLQLVCLALLGMTNRFSRGEEISPAAVPRVWLVATVLITPWAVAKMQRVGWSEQGDARVPRHVAMVTGLLAIYVLGMSLVGFYIASAVFLLATMRMLGERRGAISLAVIGGWLLLVYLLFERTLHLSLPQASWLGAFVIR
jgi:tripartite-type tricarboxylate transporter receptor subunit TctC